MNCLILKTILLMQIFISKGIDSSLSKWCVFVWCQQLHFLSTERFQLEPWVGSIIPGRKVGSRLGSQVGCVDST